MDAVIFSGPLQITVERRPKPEIQNPVEAIVKVSAAGICGSDLHMYRGHQQTKTGHIMGHESVGIVESIGSDVSKVKPGDRVICLFSDVCMTCWYCKHGYTNRCSNGGASYGSQLLDGSQAEYVRIRHADGGLFPAPQGMDDKTLLMMCDIFPTGYYGVTRALSFFGANSDYPATNGTTQDSEFIQQNIRDAVFVILGCGPVGLCAVLTARAKGVRKLYAVDSVDDRLEEAQRFGATPLKLGRDDVKKIVSDATEGRGADAVVEVVGNPAALRSAYDLVRPCGVISSVGFHQGDLPFTALEAYSKNVTVNFGRAPARKVFLEALELLQTFKDKLAGFFTHDLPLSEAAKGYEMFNKQLARKVVLRP